MADTDWLFKRALLTPDKVAVVCSETKEEWTFNRLNIRAEQLAAYFMDRGIEKGDRVGLLSPNHIAYFDFLFACNKIGAIFVPLNWKLSNDELKYVLGDCSPKLIGVHKGLNRSIQELSIQGEILFTDTGGYDALLNKELENHNFRYQAMEDDPLVIIYTGGTTGKPKGAVLSRRSIFYNAINTIVSWNLTDQDTTLTSIPMFHTGGLNALSLPILMAGGTVILSENFKAEKAISDLLDYHCSIVLFVPTMYHMIIETDQFKMNTFPSIKVFLSGGAPCPLEIYEAFESKGLLFKEGYGLTEAGPNNFYITPEEAYVKRGSVGKPMILNDVKIMNGDSEVLVPHEIGELLVFGGHSFQCYWNNEAATKEALKDGWLKTGDLAKKDEDGYYYIVGRKKEMIITGGENVYPLEVEQVILSHPYVDEAAVIGIPHEKWGEIVTAFISVKMEQLLTEGELLQYCSSKLAKYKLPKQIYFLKEIPKTHVGKIDKVKLLSDYALLGK